MNSSDATSPAPLVSVVVVNYNCKKWLDRFFPSIRAQTIFDRVEVILVDNTSTDGSAEICQKEMATWPNGVFLATGGKKTGVQQLDHNEDIEVVTIPLDDLKKLFLENKIVQSLHANCIFYALRKMGEI